MVVCVEANLGAYVAIEHSRTPRSRIFFAGTNVAGVDKLWGTNDT